MKSTGLKKNLKKSIGASDRKAFIEFGNEHITVKRQAKLLGINRSSVYRKPPVRTISDEELFIMRQIDKIHTDEPTWGYRTITTILKRDHALVINKKRVRRIMRDITPNISAPTCCGILESIDRTKSGVLISHTSA